MVCQLGCSIHGILGLAIAALIERLPLSFVAQLLASRGTS